jgi:hypothetical protein
MKKVMSFLLMMFVLIIPVLAQYTVRNNPLVNDEIIEAGAFINYLLTPDSVVARINTAIKSFSPEVALSVEYHSFDTGAS